MKFAHISCLCFGALVAAPSAYSYDLTLGLQTGLLANHFQTYAVYDNIIEGKHQVFDQTDSRPGSTIGASAAISRSISPSNKVSLEVQLNRSFGDSWSIHHVDDIIPRGDDAIAFKVKVRPAFQVDALVKIFHQPIKATQFFIGAGPSIMQARSSTELDDLEEAGNLVSSLPGINHVLWGFALTAGMEQYITHNQHVSLSFTPHFYHKTRMPMNSSFYTNSYVDQLSHRSFTLSMPVVMLSYKYDMPLF